MDCNLKNLTILTGTKLQPDIDRLAGVKQRKLLVINFFFL
jgi:hypothetical protein